MDLQHYHEQNQEYHQIYLGINHEKQHPDIKYHANMLNSIMVFDTVIYWARV